jgi:N-dimethylarginine dimethylaminohydrolase
MMDASLVGPEGAILLLFGKEGRRVETDAAETDLATAGVVIQGRLAGGATVEGGDMVLLDATTLLVGRTYRTNDEGISQLRRLLPDTEVIAFDIPHVNGPLECLHLMSVLSPLDTDLALIYPRLVPARLMELLSLRGISTVEVPDQEFATMGPNVLALGPRKALALEGNPETRRRMESAGVEVHTYRGNEISLKGDGGPTCLTRPLVRD